MNIEEPISNKEISGKSSRFSNFPVKNIKTLSLAVIFILIIGAAGYFFLQWQKTEKLIDNTGEELSAEQEATREEITDLVEQIGQLVTLPEGELPSLVTIKNANEITDNKDFFVDAQNGDQVLVYQKAKKAFLYRPSINKLINLAPINEANPNQTETVSDQVDTGQAESDTADAPASIMLRNGTAVVGLTLQFQPKLEAISDQLTIVDRENASSNNYATTQLIVINRDKQQVANRIADQLDLAIADLPAGETEPAADLLIILGRDQAPKPTPTATPTATPAGLDVLDINETADESEGNN